MGDIKDPCGAAIMPIPLNYLADPEKTLFDTLYKKARDQQVVRAEVEGETHCQATFCQGALMYPEPPPKPRCPLRGGSLSNNMAKETTPTIANNGVNRAQNGHNNGEELPDLGLIDLEDFYNQYFKDTGKRDEARLQKVREAYKKDRYYYMTTDEITFASQMSWRNSSRCIGRIQWNKLKIYDGRQITSTKELAKMIFEQMAWGSNGGNIRSSLLLTCAVGGGTQFRIWNTQYITYAGYEQEDGTILGDPAGVQVTKFALLLGWVPNGDGKRTEFDVLPLILQIGEENPEIFTIPPELVWEVPLFHPNYPKLAEMKLKWFAVPSVCFMSMEAGGLTYKFTGFNGWYMSTEILRDLCDVQRYNKLTEIAKCFNLDTEKPFCYWKDTAAIEMNIAIINSFKEKVTTIVDQYTAGETFMSHLENEQKARGGCPADWVWVVPPISGSLTPLWHQEMINYKLRPSYEYQSRPWEGFKWKGKLADKMLRKHKLTLRSVARSFICMIHLLKSVTKERRQCTILYATETGTSEKYASRLQRMFEQGFNVETLHMNRYDFSRLHSEGLILIVASTFGNGDAPDNGRNFEKELKLRKQDVSHVNITNFAVFALGSTAFPQFCAFGKRVDKAMENCGFKRMVEVTCGDEQGNQEGAFAVWAESIFKKSVELFSMSTSVSLIQKSIPEVKLNDVDVNYCAFNTDMSQPVEQGLSAVHDTEVKRGLIIDTQLLTPHHNGLNSSVLVKIECTDGAYAPGDHLGIVPMNDVDMCYQIAERIFSNREQLDLNMPLKLDRVEIKQRKEELIALRKRWLKLRLQSRKPPVNSIIARIPWGTIQEALIFYLDVNNPPSRNDLQLILATGKIDSEDEEKLTTLLLSESGYNEWVTHKRPTWLEFLREFPSIMLDVDMVLVEMPILQPRQYSISSCSDLTPGQIDLTVGVLEYQLPLGQPGDQEAVMKRGLCSSFLAESMPCEELHYYFRRNPAFHLPNYQTNVTIIMICGGSGIAPFRGFWQQRRYWRETAQEMDRISFMSLYFGCRDVSVQLHQKELKDAIHDGVIDEYNVCFSRSKRHPKRYVQDLLRTQGSKLYHLIVQSKAHIYVCGDIRLAADVQKSLDKILKISKPSSDYHYFSARNVEDNIDDLSVDMLKDLGRYHEDIYNVMI